MSHILVQRRLEVQELQELLRRWNFAGQILEYDRPFLGPLYACAAAIPVRSSFPVPAMILIIFAFLAPGLKRRRVMSALDYREESLELFKADARATKSGDVEVGAWACGDDPNPRKCRGALSASYP